MAVMLGRATVTPECGEQDLIACAREGDDRAFEELYSRYRERIAGFIQGRVHDHGRAEDIAQDVFMSALRRMRSSDQEISFKPWIYEIAKNACIDEYRRTRRLREVSLDADDGVAVDGGALQSGAPGPPDQVESRQRLQDLRGAFGGLSENHHRLLVMREFEGLSYDEIGRRTGMSRQMVESALFRARRRLSEEYDELASGRRCQQVQTVIEDGRAQSARALGARERRQIARHLSHCQPCRVMARLAGVDEELVQRRSLATKIAALLPFGLWHWPGKGGSARRALARTGSHPLTVHSLQSTGPAADAAAPGGAAIAAALIALVGAGGAVVTSLSGQAQSHPARVVPPAQVVQAGRPPTTHRASARLRVKPRSSAPEGRSTRRQSTTKRSSSGPGSAGRGSHGGSTASSGGGSGSASSGSASSTGQRGQSTVGGATQQAGSTVSTVGSGATSAVSKTVSKVGYAASKTVNNVGSTVAGTVNSVGSTASGAVNGATSAVSGTVNGVSSSVSGATSGLSSAASSTIKSLG